MIGTPYELQSRSHQYNSKSIELDSGGAESGTRKRLGELTSKEDVVRLPGNAADLKEDDDPDAIRPATEPVSPSLIDFSKQTVLNSKNYKSAERKEITPSAISTPSDSLTSKTSKHNKGYSYMNGGAEGNTMDEELNRQYSQMNMSEEQLVADANTEKQKNTHTKQFQRCCKYVSVVIVLLAGITAVVVIISTNRDIKHPESQKQEQKHEDECEISIPESVIYQQGVPIDLTCSFNKHAISAVTSMKVIFEPKYRYSNELAEESIALNDTRIRKKVEHWDITCDIMGKRLICKIVREPVRCDSGGRFSVALLNQGSLIQNKDVEFDVEGEVSHVDLNMNQTVDEISNSSIFEITCSARSACKPTTIWLFSQNGDQTIRRFDINFTCIIEYNVQDGTKVDCMGSIPGSLIKTFGTILCRPDINDTTEAKAKEASVKAPVCIGDECTFTCPEGDGDIYYIDPLDCTMFHRCVKRRFYSSPCANSTHFNPETCSCDHVDKVKGCDLDTGKRLEKLTNTKCGTTVDD